MLWKNKIKDWKLGNYLVYPNNIKNKFFYETNVCDKNMNNIYEEKFIESKSLNNIKQDYSSFLDYITKSTNKYVISFNNLSSDTILIIPIPKKNKDFTTIKDFCDNSSKNIKNYFGRK